MKNFLEGAVVALVGGAAVWGALLTPPAPEGETWAGVFPLGAALGVMAAGAWMVFSGAQRAAADGWTFPVPSRRTAEVVGLAVFGLLYQQSIALFGYQAPTALAAPAVLWAFGVRRPAGLIAGAVLCPLAFHLFFFELLGVFPPYGELFNFADLIGG